MPAKNSKAKTEGGACRKQPAGPRQPCSITMPVALQLAIIRRAKTEDRSFSATVRRAVERYLTAS